MGKAQRAWRLTDEDHVFLYNGKPVAASDSAAELAMVPSSRVFVVDAKWWAFRRREEARRGLLTSTRCVLHDGRATARWHTRARSPSADCPSPMPAPPPCLPALTATHVHVCGCARAWGPATLQVQAARAEPAPAYRVIATEAGTAAACQLRGGAEEEATAWEGKRRRRPRVSHSPRRRRRCYGRGSGGARACGEAEDASHAPALQRRRAGGTGRRGAGTRRQLRAAQQQRHAHAACCEAAEARG